MINFENFSKLISFDKGESVTHVLALSYSLNPRMLQELIVGCGFDLNQQNFENKKHHIACFVQSDRGAGDFSPHLNNIMALRLLAEGRVFLQKGAHSFHPKLWGFLYEKEGKHCIRLIISSRNLTSDNQLEGAICLDTMVGKGSEKNESLIGVLKDLSALNDPTVTAFQQAIEQTDFSRCIDHCTLSFLTPKTGLKGALLASANCEKFVAISPFLGTVDFLNSFFQDKQDKTLITRSTSYQDVVLGVRPQYLTKEVGNGEGQQIAQEEISLHGKIYAFDGVNNTNKSHLYIGSSNFSENGFFNNTELMVKVVTTKKKFAEMMQVQLKSYTLKDCPIHTPDSQDSLPEGENLNDKQKELKANEAGLKAFHSEVNRNLLLQRFFSHIFGVSPKTEELPLDYAIRCNLAVKSSEFPMIISKLKTHTPTSQVEQPYYEELCRGYGVTPRQIAFCQLPKSTAKYSPFQQASIDAIYAHFKKKNRALCADEAGLGKTFIARGVIEKQADEYLRSQLSDDAIAELKTWWVSFWLDHNGTAKTLETILEIRKKQGNSSASVKKRMVAFISAVLEQTYKPQENFSIKECYEVLMKPLNSNEIPSVKFWFRVMKHLPNLIVGYQENGRRHPAWDLFVPHGCPIKPFRVLYVCSNLAIAEQNARKLTLGIKQRSVRSGAEKADRLSTLWYFLEKYPTPYLEVYPITSTVTTKDTKGTDFEREILEINEKNWEDITGKNNAREKAREHSLESLQPNLVILDEFQNFAQLLFLMEPSIAPVPTQKDNSHKKQDSAKEIDSEAEEGEIRQQTDDGELKAMQGVMSRYASSKFLFLSATPFHSVENNGENKLDFSNILVLLQGDKSEFEKLTATTDKEGFLCDLGLFRNERHRLLGKSEEQIHWLETENQDLLQLSSAFETAQGCPIKNLVLACPDFIPKDNIEKGDYTIHLKQGVTFLGKNHPRYQALERIVCCPVAQPAPLAQSWGEVPLLWIPPTRPSSPLGGVFREYADFSKTLVFSNLKGVPTSVARLLNEKMTFQYPKYTSNPDECVVKKYVAEKLKESLQVKEDSIVNHLVKLLTYTGLSTAEELIQYCEDGCFSDMLGEFGECYTDDGGKELKLCLDYLLPNGENALEFAESLTMDKLIAKDSGATFRRAFNSPFPPFVAISTSIGSEGLDFHLYCNRLVHYSKPQDVIALEQKNGRIDRRNSLAVRRNWRHRTLNPMEYDRTGGLSPYWDGGEHLHFYFLYTKDTAQKKEIEVLLKSQARYRKQLGSDKKSPLHEHLNLSPFFKRKSD